MSALQSIDTALFRFINGTLQNHFFDALMPVFAGGGWFLALLFILGATAIWKGGTRGRLCLLMLAIVLPMGDGWITNTIKHAVDRRRPCFTLEKVNLPMRRAGATEEDEWYRQGCSDSRSMPSGHASNCFAATMVAWIFFRRTLRFTLPLACIVALSRIYLGFHYPSDVLAGAILGAGYGVAIVLALDAVWQFAGRRWFPLWWRALPSLTLSRAEPHIATHESRPTHPDINQHWLRVGYIAIALMFVARIVYLATNRIELSEDEAYQWLWSKHLALSYFSKPPLIAYVQWLGTHLFGDNQFGVRFFSPVCAAIGSLAALRFFAKHVSARAGAWLVLIVNVTPMLAGGSILMTVDPLLVLFWSLAMFAGWRAVQPEGSAKHWALVGLWMGLAFLSKYTALLQWLCWAVFFLLWKPARVHLRRPGPYVAIAVNFIGALPVILWNAPRGWVTALHVANDARAGEGWRFGGRAPLEFLGGTFALLHPIFFVALVWAAVAFWKRDSRDPLLRFFFAMGAPLFLVYALYTFHSSVEINWIAAAVIPLFCLMAAFWDRRFEEGVRHLRAWLTIALLSGAFAVVLLHETDLVKKVAGIHLPPGADPLRRVRGWKQMAQIVEREQSDLAVEGRPVFVIGGHYGTASLLSFYLPGARTAPPDTPLVYYRYMVKPNTQFYFWPTYAGTRRGQNAIYVQEKNKPAGAPPDIVKQFASVTEIGNFPVRHRNRVMHNIQVFACRDLQR